MRGSSTIEFALIIAGVLTISVFLLGQTMIQAEPVIIKSAVMAHYIDHPNENLPVVKKEESTTVYYVQTGKPDIVNIISQYAYPTEGKLEAPYKRGEYYDVQIR